MEETVKLGGDVPAEQLDEAVEGYLSTIFRLTQAKYDSEVNVILEEIASARESQDFEKIHLARKATKEWILAFRDMREVAIASAGKEDITLEPTLEFIDKQIGFFSNLDKELGEDLKISSYEGIRKELEGVGQRGP